MNKRLFANVLSAFMMGFLYAYFDFHIQKATQYTFMNSLFPWIIMYSLFIIPNVIINYKHIFYGFANASLGLSIEDLSYWFWAKTLPKSWAWFYPVVYYVPVDDVFGILLAIFFYYYGEKSRKRNIYIYGF